MHREKIEKYVEDNRDFLIENIKRLVRIPSVKGEPQPGQPFGEGPDNALDEAMKIGDEFGFKTTNYNSYVGTVDFSDAPAGLDILAHLDVVPAPPEKWTVTQPFEPVEKDGKLYGRGASDNKGPAVASMLAMKAVKDLGIPLKKNVRVILGTDEENGGEDIDYYYSKEKVAPMTFSPDASFPVINVEKGRFKGTISAEYPVTDELPRLVRLSCGVGINVVPDHAVVVVEGFKMSQINEIAREWAKETKLSFVTDEENDQIEIDIRGVGGHAAEPELSRNAATGALNLISRLPFAQTEDIKKLNALSEVFPYGDWHGKAAGIAMNDEISGDLTISLNILNVKENHFDAEFDSRTALCSTDENTLNVISKKLKSVNLELSDYSVNAGHHVPEDSHFIQTLLKVYEDYSGNKGECLAIGGGTYVHGLDNAVAFGATLPGTTGNIHGADEFAVIDELLLSVKIFAQVIIDLCS